MTMNADEGAAGAAVGLKELEAFQRAIADHGFTSEYVATASQGRALFDVPNRETRRREMRKFLTDHVFRHFTFEEKEVFPALRPGRPPSVGWTIDELLYEHRRMRRRARALQATLARLDSASSAERWARAEEGFRDLLRALLDHSMKEDNLFLALKQDIR